MKHALTFLLTSLVFVGVGCKETSTQNHYQDGQPVVELDGGKRWFANAETTQGIEAMLALTDAHLTNPTPELKPLKENLLAEITDIFKKCTMKGESHEQLHNYLLSLKDKLDRLNTSENEQTVEDIKEYLETYKHYFE